MITRELPLLTLRQANKKITVLKIVFLSQNQTFKEPLKRREIPMYAFEWIIVVGPYQRIAEEPGVLRKEIVRRIDLHRPQVLDGKDRRRARIAFAKRVNLPDAGDEPREMRDEAAFPAVRIRIFALTVMRQS